MKNEGVDTNSTIHAGKPAPGRRKPLWLRLLKWIGISAGVIVLLVILVLGGAVLMLSPDRLTPLVTDFSSQYLNAEVKARRVELSFWSTFPRVNLEVDGLEIISRSLRHISTEERAMLPADADTLARIAHFNGSVNLPMLLNGSVSLYNVEIDGGELNLVSLRKGVANYDIIPPTEQKEAAEEIPDISVNRFEIKGEIPIRYFEASDSIDVTLRLLSTRLTGDSKPTYNVALEGKGSARFARYLRIPIPAFGIDGGIRWSHDNPYALALDGFTVSAGNLQMSMDADIAFGDTLEIQGFRLKAPDLRISDAINLIPDSYRGELARLNTDISLQLAVELLKPFRPQSSSLPTVKVILKIPEGRASYDRLNLRSIKTDIVADIDGADLDASVIRINDLQVIGTGMGFSLCGDITELMRDARFEGEFRGGIDLGTLPSVLTDRLHASLAGMLTADTHIILRKSYLNRNGFHRIRAKGTAALSRFRLAMQRSPEILTTRHASFKFGTNSRISTDSLHIDSLLTIAMTSDSLRLDSRGMHMILRQVTTNVATRNVSASGDTTSINPIGARIRANSAIFRSDSDSITVRIRDMEAITSLTRYNNEARRPLLSFDFNSSAMSYNDRLTRLSLRESSVSLKMHPKNKPHMSRSVQLRFDSLATLYPHLRVDSVFRMARNEARRLRRLQRDSLHIGRLQRNNGRTNIDFDIDNSVRDWLRWCDARGSLKASSGRMFTPYFPISNTLKDIDVEFTTDSVALNRTTYRMGRSDMLITGYISNIIGAVTSTRSPLRVDLDIVSDTLDINQAAEALFAGSAFSEKAARHHHVAIATDDDETAEKSVAAHVKAGEKAAFIVPSNITAELRLKASNVLYSDIWFHRLTGVVGVFDGAVNLHRFGAYTAMGSMDITALYSAPDKKNLKFAAGLVVRKLNLHKFLHLMPEIDTIMPLLREVEGIITAEAAIATDLDSMMDIKFHTLDAALKFSGDSLVLLDHKTFSTAAKWLMFKQKQRNLVEHMSVEAIIHDSQLELFPFMFDIDRYKLGVSGTSNLGDNYDYHIAVLKSPLPFKFGVNIKGHDGKMHISLGKARFNEHAIASRRELTDTTRINLLEEIEKVFRFGVRSGKRNVSLEMPQLRFNPSEYEVADTLTHADSLFFIREGILPAPPGFHIDNPDAGAPDKASKRAKDKKRKNK